ncbi:hypothetical protein [Winogradskyella costae]|uniref:hypothetical protein n=1 Tax=Winogradskyella costae TaxID=2697008 RepID=UPI0015CD4EE5|nr:hypothetical protein [Winogradskyella costae]
MKKLLLLTLLFSISFTSFVTSQSKMSQRETFETTYQNTKATVKTQHYQFVADVIYDGQQREILNGDSNQIDINNLNVKGILHGFSKDKAIYTLKETNSDINTIVNDENQQISIVVKMSSYSINIEVKPNGNAFLTLTGNDISKQEYAGKLVRI